MIYERIPITKLQRLYIAAVLLCLLFFIKLIRAVIWTSFVGASLWDCLWSQIIFLTKNFRDPASRCSPCARTFAQTRTTLRPTKTNTSKAVCLFPRACQIVFLRVIFFQAYQGGDLDKFCRSIALGLSLSLPSSVYCT